MRRKQSPVDRLRLLREQDHFRYWNSLDDERVCVLCARSFAGHDVTVSRDGVSYALHCPTSSCRSQVHQWVYRVGNRLLCEDANADWWRALSEPVNANTQIV